MCNRIEIYGVAGCADDAFGHLAAFSGSFPEFSKYAYVKYGETEVFHHALMLGTGLESQLKGEPQILAQLDAWNSGGTLPLPIKVLWNKAIKLARKTRIASRLSDGGDNIATLVYDDIEKRLAGREKHEIIVVGTGKIAELFAKYRPSGAHLIFVAHKNYQKAEMLSKYSGGETLPLQDLPRIITKTDALIGATSSPHYILKKEHFDKYPVKREHPLCIYDLAIPRDVEPAVGGINDIYLCNLDSLKYLFSAYNKSVQDRIELASDLIEDALGTHQEVINEKAH